MTVFFSHNLLDDQVMVTLNDNRAPLSNVLDTVLTPRNIAYRLGDNDSILLRKRDAKTDKDNKFTISGTAYDEKGQPIEVATV